MQASKARTVLAPSIEADSPSTRRDPAILWSSAKEPLRVLVRNISGIGLNALISYDNTTLQTGRNLEAAAFTLPPGISEIFPLAPGESLYAASPNSVPARLSIVISAAFPFEVVPARPAKT